MFYVNQPPWPDETIQQMTRLWVVERATSGAIAQQISTPERAYTRNAVLGKIKRLGLLGAGAPERARNGAPPGLDSVAARALAPRKPPSLPPSAPAAELPPPPAPAPKGARTGAQRLAERAANRAYGKALARYAAEASTQRHAGGAIPLLGLKPHHCRWPTTEPKGHEGSGRWLFCGARRRPDGPYCQEHAERAFNHPPKRAA